MGVGEGDGHGGGLCMEHGGDNVAHIHVHVGNCEDHVQNSKDNEEQS